jgi:hypothetical protein
VYRVVLHVYTLYCYSNMICVDMRSLVNYLERHGIDASLDIIERTGVDIIERHVLWFTDLLIRKLQERG